jgi:sugar (pentulose or hexulose) kinase
MTPVICIFDIGKTNKKVFLFDEDYKIRYEKSIELPEIKDEDGFPCEDVHVLTHWVKDTFRELALLKEFAIKAINVSAHGASFVHVDESGKPVAPLYNYLKPFPENLKQTFYKTYGGENKFAQLTASPVLGNLNSGMQLYWLKYQRPHLFKKIKYSVHLPEYISYLFSGQFASGITSIGCHTNLWDFTKNNYHPWVSTESILQKLAPIKRDSHTDKVLINNQAINVGLGLHDSSAALIPYLLCMKEPFVLLSTGTWSISLNPFNDTALTADELQKDCLCYLTYEGKPVKASRLFAGHWHDEAFKKLAERFHKDEHAYTQVSYNKDFINSDSTFESAYHMLIAELISMQKTSTDLILQPSIKNIYVDGGFSKNALFMNMLAKVYPEVSTYTADLHQATALGAALGIHESWNSKAKPSELIKLEKVKG